jgi:translocation and assembly module TamB
LRIFNRRFILRTIAVLAILLVVAIGAVVAYLNSAAFETRARQYIIQEIERTTGTKVTLGEFGWDLWARRFRLEDLTLRGLEPEHQLPLAHFGRIDVGLNFRLLLQRRVDLFELTITNPRFHVEVTPDGRTNIPEPAGRRQPTNFEFSIDNFNIVDGAAILNERRINLDLSLQNLGALLKYHPDREVLEVHMSYDGVVDRAPDVKLAIPYSLSADFDYTRATIVAHRVLVTSGRNEARLQGKINQVLSADISGKLDYAGSFQVRFLNYFFEAEKFAGNADGAGSLEFSRNKFYTEGNVTSEAIDFEGWHTSKISGQYIYRYPDRHLTLKNFKSAFMGGSITGDLAVENLPGPSRVVLNVNYANIDAAGLTRAYPWDPKYRILSTATGSMNGWFTGKVTRFNFSGHADLKSYQPAAAPDASVVALPLDGSADYNLIPREARVENADLRFRSTAVQAAGRIHATMTDLSVAMSSSDLKDLSFIYADANGSGTFKGTVSGAIVKPVLNGDGTLENHVFRDLTIEHAAGNVRLDMTTEDAVLKDVRVKQGNSEILISGTAALSGTPVDLRIQSDRVAAEDIKRFVNRDIEGVFAGDVRVTALSPAIKVEGDIRADNLIVDNRQIGNARGHVRYFEPEIEIEQLSVRQGDSTLNGNVSFNTATEAVRFSGRVNTVDVGLFYPLGLPETVQGVIRTADVRGEGTIRQPRVSGSAVLQDLSVAGEVFPEARVNLVSTGTKLDVEMAAGQNLNLKAQIDTAATGYPFTATARFAEYHLENFAKFSRGSIIATGSANVSGLLTDSTRIRGEGRIDNAEIRMQDIVLRPAQPFTFGFDPNELTLGNVTVTGQSTQVTLAGTVGLRDPAPLNLKVNGQADLKLIEAQFPEMLSSGVVNLQVDVRGTVQTPDLRGTAVLSNASLRRQGFFTGLTNLNGTLSFNQNQIRVNNIDGRAGGGTVHAEGSAVLQGATVQAMAIQLDAKNVRLRGYPEGLRTVVDARLNLRGGLDSPLLDGNVQIQSLAYRSSFEDFLALLSEENLRPESSPLGRLRLSLHVEGGRNITIRNQLAQVEARVDIDWKGTVDEPSITGHVEASGGTLSFQGNRYTVTRGNIDFVDPLRIDPIVDIEAESQVRDYRVILSITGRGSNPKLAMRSDPPLPELEIVSLIAGGSTRDEINRRREELAVRGGTSPGTGNVPTSEQLFQSGAASILFDLLQQRVGNRLGLLGTGRVRIDPFLVGAENNPGARITLSEQVTKDLSVTYSQDLASNRQQVILIEYFFSRNTSIVASRDELGNFGLDVRHRTRLR